MVVILVLGSQADDHESDQAGQNGEDGGSGRSDDAQLDQGEGALADDEGSPSTVLVGLLPEHAAMTRAPALTML